MPAALAFSPFLLLAAQDYGGEAVLRITLYSALGCAAVLGPALANALQRGAAFALPAVGWTIVMMALTAGSSYTLWSVNLIRPEDVAAARWLAEERSDSVVIPMIANWPGRTYADYARFVGPLSRVESGVDDILAANAGLDPQQKSQSLPLNEDMVTEVALEHPDRETYVVFTESMRQCDAYYAIFSPGGYDATLKDMAASPDWQVARHQSDLWVFHYVGPDAPVE